jgi:protein-S-isoprenylcysteine O-methyltransferase Ste14
MRNAIKSIIWFAIIGACLFWPAGTFDWPAAWVFLVEMTGGTAVTVVWLSRSDPALLKERMAGPFQKGQAAWDKLFMLFITVIWMGWLVLMALDVKRWALSDMPVALMMLGALLIALGFFLVLRTFKENSFAAPVVRIQEERQQRVISTGPYAIVRHPMYASALVYMLGMPLLLGSWIGLAVFPLMVGLLIVRIFGEEATLRAGLAGYSEYAKKVRWRLIPRLW